MHKELFVNNLKDEFVKAIMQSLKIEKNPFIFSTIDEFIKDINSKDYKKFMADLFGKHHQYLNGIDRVAKVAETFKPTEVKDNSLENEAKRLIALVYAINDQVYRDSQTYKIQFNDLIKKIKLEEMIESKDLSVLNQVKPHTNAKRLISEISNYQDGNIQLQAFIEALKYKGSDLLQIAKNLRRLGTAK